MIVSLKICRDQIILTNVVLPEVPFADGVLPKVSSLEGEGSVLSFFCLHLLVGFVSSFLCLSFVGDLF